MREISHVSDSGLMFSVLRNKGGDIAYKGNTRVKPTHVMFKMSRSHMYINVLMSKVH